MVDIAKLEAWINENPEGADEPFMNVTTQRKVTLKMIYEELKKEKDTGVAIVDENLLQVIKDVDDWLKEV
jgi:hypothetical protein